MALGYDKTGRGLPECLGTQALCQARAHAGRGGTRSVAASRAE